MSGTGTFYGIGLGPGDPELLTRKAARLLSEVSWIFYPFEPRTGSSFAQQILTALDLPATKMRQVSLNMSQERGPDQQTYATVAATMAQEARQGNSVAWVTLGDPLFYSTFIYLYQEMQQRFPDVPVRIVPGITSAYAAAAVAGVPISVLDEHVAVVPAVYGIAHLSALLDNFATVFLLKVHRVFDQLLATLETLPQPVQATYVERVGTPEQRVVTELATLRGQALTYFSLVILRHDTSTRVGSLQKDSM